MESPLESVCRPVPLWLCSFCLLTHNRQHPANSLRSSCTNNGKGNHSQKVICVVEATGSLESVFRPILLRVYSFCLLSRIRQHPANSLGSSCTNNRGGNHSQRVISVDEATVYLESTGFGLSSYTPAGLQLLFADPQQTTSRKQPRGSLESVFRPILLRVYSFCLLSRIRQHPANSLGSTDSKNGGGNNIQKVICVVEATVYLGFTGFGLSSYTPAGLQLLFADPQQTTSRKQPRSPLDSVCRPILLRVYSFCLLSRIRQHPANSLGSTDSKNGGGNNIQKVICVDEATGSLESVFRPILLRVYSFCLLSRIRQHPANSLGSSCTNNRGGNHSQRVISVDEATVYLESTGFGLSSYTPAGLQLLFADPQQTTSRKQPRVYRL
ncbi:hypothetical protein J6590_067103 [Homalodisca vitripennis]|nr:hypothetical protein J6590_067103 [Homalodisca vitripennis]